MSAAPPEKPIDAAEKIGRGAERMQKARDEPPPSPIRGFGVFGMIGWTIAVTTLGGVFLGLWLDRTVPQTFSWTISLLFVGVVVGGVIAWRWIGEEHDQD